MIKYIILNECCKVGEKMYIGIEFGSTNIKAVKINNSYNVEQSSAYGWKSSFDNGVWTYSLDEVWQGINSVLDNISDREEIEAAGVSAMMHGYLAFDKDWNLLVPFRTWQNTITQQAAEELTNLFGVNIPQRWSIAHLYQAILNKEEHTSKIAHITTLAAYVHYMLTGENVIGIGDASGMFPIDSKTGDYDSDLAEKFNAILKEQGLNYTIKDILPKAVSAGKEAGKLTKNGAKLINNKLKVGTPFAAPEGDAGTGMVATNSVTKKSGNVSAGTSIFAMVVLDKPLKNLHTEIDMVTTPDGSDVAMVHCNNCTNDLNVWAKMFGEILEAFGNEVDTARLYSTLFKKSLEAEADCSDIISYNYMAGEVITGLNEGAPLIFRKPDSNMNLANFMRSLLYGAMATLKLGMDILSEEGVEVSYLLGHGGLFKNKGVCDMFMASALNIPIKCMSSASEGGPFGMAILAAYLKEGGNLSLPHFLNEKVFRNIEVSTALPEKETIDGFNKYMNLYVKGLEAEKAAVLS